MALVPQYIFVLGLVSSWLGFSLGWLVRSYKRITPKEASQVLAKESRRVRERLKEKRGQVLGV